MGYTTIPGMVRVDIFKRDSKKWVDTISVDMSCYYSHDFLVDAFREALMNEIEGRYSGKLAVCLEPYHTNSYPVMVEIE